MHVHHTFDCKFAFNQFKERKALYKINSKFPTTQILFMKEKYNEAMDINERTNAMNNSIRCKLNDSHLTSLSTYRQVKKVYPRHNKLVVHRKYFPSK